MAKIKAIVYEFVPSGDAEFDEWEKNVWEALEKSGNAEGLTREEARLILAKRVTEFAGKDMSHLYSGKAVKKAKLPDEQEVPAAPLTLRIPTPGAEPYWYEAPGQSELIDHFIESRRQIGTILAGGLLILGPAGVGKTMGVIRRIARLGYPFLKMDAATVTDPGKWFGRREIDKDGTRYEESDFIRAVREGTVILIDEINRLHPAISNPIMAMLDGSQAIHLSDLNVTIPVHPQTVVIATANIGAAFGGTYKIDHALRRRFPYTIERGFPPIEDEIRILTSYWPECDTDAAANLVRIATESRNKWEGGDLRVPIDTATLTNAAMLVASGYSERDALEFTVLPMYDGNADGQIGQKSERAMVAGMIDGALGRA